MDNPVETSIYLELLIATSMITLDSIVREMVVTDKKEDRDNLYDRFYHVKRYMGLCTHAERAGWTEFSLEKVYEEEPGWLCINDFSLFEELEGKEIPVLGELK